MKKKQKPKPRAVQSWATMHVPSRTITSVDVGYTKDYLTIGDDEVAVRVRIVPVE